MIHIGHLIKEVFKSREEHSIQWLAQQLNCNRRNIYDIFNRPTVDTQLLERISAILNHDFFADISAELNIKADDNAQEKPS